MVKKKVSRKELLKGPDEFLTFSERGLHFIREHVLAVKIAGTVILAAVVVYLGVSGYFRYANQKGQEAYNEAFKTLEKDMGLSRDQEELKKSEEYFKKVLDDHGLAKVSRLASAELAFLTFRGEKYDEALSLYQTFLKKLPVESPYRPMTALAIASCQEAKGDLNGAVETLKELLSGPDTFVKEQAYLSLARVYRLNNQDDKAKETLKGFMDKFKDSSFLPMAKAYMEK